MGDKLEAVLRSENGTLGKTIKEILEEEAWKNENAKDKTE